MQPEAPFRKPIAFRLDGRRALVTGASRGLGAEIAMALAEAGASVVMVARGREDIEAAVGRLSAQGLEARAVAMDVCDVDAVERLFAEEQGIDIVVNNAGTNRPKPLSESSEDDFDAVFDLNVRSVYFLSKAAAGSMVAGGRPGVILNISSQMGHVGAANRTLYCASKHAIEGLTKAMAIELAPFGIRVNSIAPTFIETDLTKSYFEDEAFRASVLSKIKLGRLGQASDVAAAALYLASDYAGMVTGTSLIVDGGWTAG